MTAQDARKVAIVPLETLPQHRSTVAQWVHAEWPAESIEAAHAAVDVVVGCPAHLLALHGEEPIGFLGFRLYPLDGDTEPSLWVNILYVRAEWRSRGIGARLLAEGTRQAASHGATGLHIYTETPDYYRRHGWAVLREARTPGYTVLRRCLGRAV